MLKLFSFSRKLHVPSRDMALQATSPLKFLDPAFSELFTAPNQLSQQTCRAATHAGCSRDVRTGHLWLADSTLNPIEEGSE